MNTSAGQIFFHFLTPAPNLRNRTALKAFITHLFAQEGKALDTINYMFCTDEYLLSLNKKFLKHNTYTDILTFELNASSAPLISDIYISVDRVKENATTIGTTISNELLRVIFHGALHLCGYRDKIKKDAKIIRSKEDYYLQLYQSFT